MKYFSVYKESRTAAVTLFVMTEDGREDQSYKYKQWGFLNSNYAAVYTSLCRKTVSKVFEKGIPFEYHTDSFNPPTWRLE
jgi:hypothetical protein